MLSDSIYAKELYMSINTHPIQPIQKDELGTLRFKQNKIVRDLLDYASERGFGLNEIARKDYSKEDHVQLAQLIGYSLSGFGTLSYVSDSDYNAAHKMYTEGTSELESRLEDSVTKLAEAREIVRQLAATLFNIDPSDLEE